MGFEMTAHAKSMCETKGIDVEEVRAVWDNPAVTYPSHRYPEQHKRTGHGLCLACDNLTGKVITVFADRIDTPLRADQRKDRDAVKWARKNGMT